MPKRIDPTGPGGLGRIAGVLATAAQGARTQGTQQQDAITDMTGLTVVQFGVIPTSPGQSDWPHTFPVSPLTPGPSSGPRYGVRFFDYGPTLRNPRGNPGSVPLNVLRLQIDQWGWHMFTVGGSGTSAAPYGPVYFSELFGY